MNRAIILAPEELAQVRGILRRTLPSEVAVFVFGSRAGGRVKPWSDLDLLLDAGTPVSASVLGRLAMAFDESRLPYRVDLVDRAAISPEFARIVDRTKVRFDLEDAE
ncbi:MAG: nucleotidyltransferase domain-containing protein [Novosphingobium sp.]